MDRSSAKWPGPLGDPPVAARVNRVRWAGGRRCPGDLVRRSRRPSVSVCHASLTVVGETPSDRDSSRTVGKRCRRRRSPVETSRPIAAAMPLADAVVDRPSPARHRSAPSLCGNNSQIVTAVRLELPSTGMPTQAHCLCRTRHRAPIRLRDGRRGPLTVSDVPWSDARPARKSSCVGRAAVPCERPMVATVRTIRDVDAGVIEIDDRRSADDVQCPIDRYDDRSRSATAEPVPVATSMTTRSSAGRATDAEDGDRGLPVDDGLRRRRSAS